MHVRMSLSATDNQVLYLLLLLLKRIFHPTGSGNKQALQETHGQHMASYRNLQK